MSTSACKEKKKWKSCQFCRIYPYWYLGLWKRKPLSLSWKTSHFSGYEINSSATILIKAAPSLVLRKDQINKEKVEDEQNYIFFMYFNRQGGGAGILLKEWYNSSFLFFLPSSPFFFKKKVREYGQIFHTINLVPPTWVFDWPARGNDKTGIRLGCQLLGDACQDSKTF